MAELVATGPEASQRWQETLPEGEAVRLGRSPRRGWKIPWDNLISREHAEVLWKKGRLHVSRLKTARNPIYLNEESVNEFELAIGEKFRIGETVFHLIETSRSPDSANPLQRFSYGPDELVGIPFGEERERLEALSTLPRLVSNAKSNEDFAASLCTVILNAITKSDAVAVVQYEDISVADKGKPTLMRWASRLDHGSRFQPSRRLIAATLQSRQSMLYVWPDEADLDEEFTGSGTLDWAFCTPLGSEFGDGWCIYVSGQRTDDNAFGNVYLDEDDLKGDLRFTQFMAEFVVSMREAQRLQKQQDEMTHFFSPAVIETISRSASHSTLTPKEQDISVLYCDVRGFSRRAEKAHHNLFELLNRVSNALSVMTRAIMTYEGVVADFQGDAALAFWGWPNTLDDGPVSACRAALAMHKEFMNENRNPDSSLAGFQVGIGIGHGRAIAGKIGSEEQSKVGVFGPVVNRASRLEGITKQFRVPILIDEPTAEFVNEHMGREARTRCLGCVRPQGMDTATMVYELLPSASDKESISDDLIHQHQQAVDHFIAGRWTEAYDLLESTPVSNRAKELLSIFIAENDFKPPGDWDGVITLASK